MIKSIGDILKESQKVKRPRSRRALLIQEISEKLKKEREENPYYFKGEKKVKLKPLTDKQIAVRVGHYNEQQLLDLLSSCKHSKNFSKTFWYLTKVTNEL